MEEIRLKPLEMGVCRERKREEERGSGGDRL